MSLSKIDIEQFKKHGITPENIHQQLNIFSNGIPFVKIFKAGSIGNGIESIAKADQNKLIEFYELNNQKKEIIKFVPASGAATRMFQFLFMFLSEYNPNEYTLDTFLSEQIDKLINKYGVESETLTASRVSEAQTRCLNDPIIKEIYQNAQPYYCMYVNQ